MRRLMTAVPGVQGVSHGQPEAYTTANPPLLDYQYKKISFPPNKTWRNNKLPGFHDTILGIIILARKCCESIDSLSMWRVHDVTKPEWKIPHLNITIFTVPELYIFMFHSKLIFSIDISIIEHIW